MNIKTKILAISIIITTNIYSSEYIVQLDNKHYNQSIAIENYTPPNNEPEDPIYESPYNDHRLYSVDWKSAGDNRVFLDTKTGIEWLKLSETSAKSVATVESEISTLYNGWRIATMDEVENLIAYIDHIAWRADNYQVTLDKNQALAFKDSIGGYLGKYYLNSTQVTFAGVYTGGTHVYFNRWGMTPSSVSAYYTVPASDTGVFLVSEGGTTYSSQNNPAINTPVILP